MVATRLRRVVSSRLGSSRSAPTWRPATRRGSSRSVNFFRDRCTLPEVHFRYPFSRHDFRYDGRERFVTGRQSVTIRRESSPLLRPVTDRVYWTWVPFRLRLNHHSYRSYRSPVQRLDHFYWPATILRVSFRCGFWKRYNSWRSLNSHLFHIERENEDHWCAVK